MLHKQKDNKGQDYEKIIKEDENFIWYETKSGIGYVASKHAYFHLQPERSKREDMEGPSHIPDKGWPDKNAGFP